MTLLQVFLWKILQNSENQISQEQGMGLEIHPVLQVELDQAVAVEELELRLAVVMEELELRLAVAVRGEAHLLTLLYRRLSLGIGISQHLIQFLYPRLSEFSYGIIVTRNIGRHRSQQSNMSRKNYG